MVGGWCARDDCVVLLPSLGQLVLVAGRDEDKSPGVAADEGARGRRRRVLELEIERRLGPRVGVELRDRGSRSHHAARPGKPEDHEARRLPRRGLA
eukprot:14395644-Alexandrium_andersonii.AAC.1